MATVVNARDVALLATSPRTLSVSLPSNIVVPTGNVTGLNDLYDSSKQVVLNATSLLFQVPKSGAVLPANISMTAVLKNITGTVTFSVESGTCTFTSTGNTITILPAGLTTTTATIKASVTFNGVTYEDRVTIAKVAEGVDSVVGLLSNEACTISTGFDGVVSSFSNAGGTFYVFDGLTNKTGNAAVTYSVVSSSGVTLSIASTGVYTVTAMSADTGSATLRAVYNGVTIDKIYSISKSKAGANSQLVTLLTDSQVFKVAKDNTVTPAQVTFTALANNLAGSPTFTVTSGTATLTGTGSSRIMTYSNMSTDAVTVQVTWDGKTDSITIVKVREGVDSITGFLTNEAALVSADSAGTITTSLSTVGGTFKVFNGITDVTGASVTYTVASTSNMSATIASTGVYTITGLTADSGSVTFRAVYNGVTIDKVYSLTKSKAGSIGSNGSRGTVNLSRAITGSAWSDTEAATAISGAGYGTPINRDIVTLYNTSTSYSETRFYDTAAPVGWKTLDAYINGNLLVAGTVSSGALSTGAVTAGKISVTNLASIKSDLGAITAGSLNINGKFIVDANGNVTIQSATSGQRIVITNSLITVYGSDGVTPRVRLGIW